MLDGRVPHLGSKIETQLWMAGRGEFISSAHHPPAGFMPSGPRPAPRTQSIFARLSPARSPLSFQTSPTGSGYASACVGGLTPAHNTTSHAIGCRAHLFCPSRHSPPPSIAPDVGGECLITVHWTWWGGGDCEPPPPTRLTPLPSGDCLLHSTTTAVGVGAMCGWLSGCLAGRRLQAGR